VVLTVRYACQNAARTMLKEFGLLHKGGRLAELKQRRAADKKRAQAQKNEPYTNGQNDPFPAELIGLR